MKNKVKRMVVLFVVFSMLWGFSIQTYALSSASLGGKEKIADDLYSVADKKDEKYYVAIWLKDIPENKINAVVHRQTGYSVEQYENHERYQAEVVPIIKQDIVNQMATLVVSNRVSTEDIAKKQQKAVSDDYNAYVSAKRDVMRSLYTKVTTDFVDKNISNISEISFQGTYFPLVLMYATRSEIDLLASNSEVEAIYPFVNAEHECHSSIEETQIGTDDWSGTKSSSYELGGYWGDGVKIGIIEAENKRFDPDAAQLSSIVGEDPANPGNKRLFYIENDSITQSPEKTGMPQW